MNKYDLILDLKIKVRSCGPCFRSIDFSLYLEGFSCINIILEILFRYGPTLDLKIKVCYYELCSYYIHFFFKYIEDYVMYKNDSLGQSITMTRNLTSKYKWVTV